jgi:hypothetical protein
MYAFSMLQRDRIRPHVHDFGAPETPDAQLNVVTRSALYRISEFHRVNPFQRILLSLVKHFA